MGGYIQNEPQHFKDRLAVLTFYLVAMMSQNQGFRGSRSSCVWTESQSIHCTKNAFAKQTHNQQMIEGHFCNNKTQCVTKAYLQDANVWIFCHVPTYHI